MDHGFTSASGTGRFYGTASKCCCPSDFPCDCKLLRSIRFLDHVQQFSFDGGNGCIIGAIANTLRLELVDFTHMPPAAAAFIGALTAGLLASFIKKSNGYPRISLTVPSIVIMVPGLYLYRAIYNFGIMSLTDAVSWFTSAIMIIVMLPLGLIFARILTDHTFRYCT